MHYHTQHKTKFFVATFILFLFSSCSFAQRDDFAGFDKGALFELMEKLDVQHDGTPSDVLNATQARWKRTGERWETADLHEDKKAELKPFFDKLELIGEWSPHHSLYDGVVILGSTFTAIEAKGRFFKQLVQKGSVQFNKIVALTGERYLTEKERDELKALGADLSVVKTEADMIRFWLKQDSIKKLFDNKEIEFVDVPATVKEDGTTLRPTTADTVSAWLGRGGKPGVYLVLSLQPHCRYQQKILQGLLPSTYDFDVVGSSDKYLNRVAVYLDAITRTLYATQTKK